MPLQTDELAPPIEPEGRTRRRRFAVAAGVVALVGIIGVSASSLGGLASGTIGADRGSVSSCDRNGVRIFYGPITFQRSAGAFTMRRFSVRQIARACRGQTLSVTMNDPSNASLASLSATITAARVNLTLPTAVPVSQIAGIAVAID